uniref:HIT-type domain-containing protein n=1 Tax=Oreochromis niloticus TaxID=8128 RepID=A0A669EEB9_ORENI
MILWYPNWRILTTLMDQFKNDKIQEFMLGNVFMIKNLRKNKLNIFCPSCSLSVHLEKKKRKTRGDHFNQRFRNNFTMLLEEEVKSLRETRAYLSAAASLSSLPLCHFCCVCGFPSHYTCTTCGGCYCSMKCLCTQRGTRCLKWILTAATLLPQL